MLNKAIVEDVWSLCLQLSLELGLPCCNLPRCPTFMNSTIDGYACRPCLLDQQLNRHRSKPTPPHQQGGQKTLDFKTQMCTIDHVIICSVSPESKRRPSPLQNSNPPPSTTPMCLRTAIPKQPHIPCSSPATLAGRKYRKKLIINGTVTSKGGGISTAKYRTALRSTQPPISHDRLPVDQYLFGLPPKNYRLERPFPFFAPFRASLWPVHPPLSFHRLLLLKLDLQLPTIPHSFRVLRVFRGHPHFPFAPRK